jgi:hypothetical protein
LTDLSTYGQVHYSGIYPGVDVVFQGNQSQLQYDFIVAPNADTDAIVLNFDGADSLSLEDGKLMIHTAAGDVTQSAPILYQFINGQRRAVSGRYKLLEGTQVGFEVGAYDASRPLVIDPVLVYSSFQGGSGNDGVGEVTVNDNGEAYLTGHTEGLRRTTAGAFSTTLTGNADVFVSRINASGTALIFTTYLGGNNPNGGDGEFSFGLALDDSNNVYVVGNTRTDDFPTTNGVLQPANGINMTNNPSNPDYSRLDAFITKLAPRGNRLEYSTYYGGLREESAREIRVNGNNEAFVTGYTTSSLSLRLTDAPNGIPNVRVSPNAFQQRNSGNPPNNDTQDALVIRLNETGTDIIYGTLFGNEGDEIGRGIAIDSQNNAYITGGSTSSKLFDNQGPGFQDTNPGGFGDSSAFVAKFNPFGTDVIWTTFVGGSADDTGRDIALDSLNQPIIVGDTDSTNFPATLPNSLDGTPTGERGLQDAFVTKLKGDGSDQVWSTFLTGTNDDIANDIAVDGLDRVYVGGTTRSANFPITSDAVQRGFRSESDAFVTQLSPSGKLVNFSTFLGGTSEDDGFSIALDPRNRVYIGGRTTSADFPTRASNSDGFPVLRAFQSSYGGGEDAFIAKISIPDNLFSGSGAAFPRDRFEPNQTSDAAIDFGKQEVDSFTIITDLSIVNTATGLPDYDWFRWSAGGSGLVTVEMEPQRGGTPLEMKVFTLDNGIFLRQLGSSSLSSSTATQRIMTNILAGQVILVSIKGQPLGAGKFGQAEYDLKLEIS